MGYREKSSSLCACLSFLVGSLEEVTLLKMRGTLMTIDPTMDRQTLSAYLSQAYQIPAIDVPLDDEERQGIISVTLETALDRLKMADTKRVGPREPEQAS